MKNETFANECKIYVKNLDTNEIVIINPYIIIELNNIDDKIYDITIITPTNIKESTLGYYDNKTNKINFLGKITLDIFDEELKIIAIGEIDLNHCNSLVYKVSGNIDNSYSVAGNNVLKKINCDN